MNRKTHYGYGGFKLWRGGPEMTRNQLSGRAGGGRQAGASGTGNIFFSAQTETIARAPDELRDGAGHGWPVVNVGAGRPSIQQRHPSSGLWEILVAVPSRFVASGGK
jgi:hypothetical protein